MASSEDAAKIKKLIRQYEQGRETAKSVLEILQGTIQDIDKLISWHEREIKKWETGEEKAQKKRQPSVMIKHHKSGIGECKKRRRNEVKRRDKYLRDIEEFNKRISKLRTL